MPEIKLKQLHMATSLESLNQKVHVEAHASPKMLVKSATTILNSAESSDKDKDEELAYVYFMRYFTVVKAIQQHDEYKKNKKYYDSLLDPKRTKKIIQRAEELSKSLHRRYTHLANANIEEKKEEKEKKLKEIKEREKEKVSKISPPKAVVTDDGFIGCDKLYSLMNEKVSSFLVVDVRPKEEFVSSSMKLSTLINIQEELLKPGLTANKAGRELAENSRLLWGRRHNYDYIIICDWSTDTLPLPPPITILIDAMEKWDPGKNYRGTSSVLKGGYELFSLKYPMLISNPRSDFIRKMSLNLSHSSSLSDKQNSLLNFDFPDLDTAFLSTPSPDRTIEYPHLGDSVTPLSVKRDLKPAESMTPPSINRNLKPKNSVPQTKVKNEDSGSFDSLNDLVSDSASTDVLNDGMVAESSASICTSVNDNPSSFVPTLGGWTSSTSSSPLDSEDEDVGKSAFVTVKKEPTVPNRALKPQELLDSLKAKKKDLDEEQTLLEQFFKAEKDTLEKLQEMEETQKIQETTQDEKTHVKLTVKETRLKEELQEKKNYAQDIEKKYSFQHKQNEEMRKLQAQLFSGQLKIDASGSSIHMNVHQKEEKEAIRASEEKRKLLLTEVEELRKKRKEKERSIIEEEERKREREEEEEEEEKKKREREVDKKKDMEEKKEHLRWATERNSRNRENFPPDGQDGKRTPSKRIGGETYTTKLRTSPRSSPVRGGSNIKRSHSALNLSQLRDDNGLDSPSVMPTFDRSLKPLNSPRRRNVNAARQRNFEPKYGSVGPTKTGLKNLGNTCYMNSIIQCLSNTFPLAKYFFEGQYSDDLNPKSNHKGAVAEEVGAVVRALWCGQYRSIAMWDLKSVVGRCHKAFQGYDQHDSHEFLLKLMDWLHDDLNLVSMKLPKMEEQNFENIPDYMAAQSVMDALQERDESIVRNCFYGLHRSVIVCHTCNHRSLTFEPFSVLTVSFPTSGRCTLKDMLYDFYKETRIEYKCSKCRRMRNCTRKFDIWKLPPVLIIHLNRFEHDVLTKKKQNFVDFPIENLNFSEHTAGPSRFHTYDLYGVSNHYGTIDGGHYTAFCKSPHKSWYKFDDHEVYDVARESVRTSAAYILFYESITQNASL